MSWAAYNDFLALARDAYGVDQGEAQALYRDLRNDLGRALRLDDIFTPEAGLFVEDVGEENEYGYELVGPDDEWIEAGEEVEVTADLAYE